MSRSGISEVSPSKKGRGAAESALRRLSPDVGAMRGWLPYWDVLASALHAQGRHRAELAAIREARARFPDRPELRVWEVRALAAERRVSDLERLWRPLEGRDVGALALEAAVELEAHGGSGAARRWYERAYEVFVAGGSKSDEQLWGRAQAAARLGKWREARRYPGASCVGHAASARARCGLAPSQRRSP